MVVVSEGEEVFCFVVVVREGEEGIDSARNNSIYDVIPLIRLKANMERLNTIFFFSLFAVVVVRQGPTIKPLKVRALT